MVVGGSGTGASRNRDARASPMQCRGGAYGLRLLRNAFRIDRWELSDLDAISHLEQIVDLEELAKVHDALPLGL